MLGALAAAAASAGLAWWIGTAGNPTLGAQTPVNAPVAPAASAPVRADPAEVIRAYETLGNVYAESGAAGVTRFARACADRLATEPRTLDFCLAFNMFSASVATASTEGRELALVRAATPPGGDAAARLAQVRALVREVGLRALGEPGRAERPSAAEPSPVKADRPPARRAAASGSSRASVAACRRRGPAAPRTVCASRALRGADVRLRAAYQRAAAAGVSRSRLGREQRQFRRAVQAAAPDRAAVARLYAGRIRALERQARSAGN